MLTWQTDPEFEEVTLKKVTEEDKGFDLERGDGWHFFASKIDGHVPKPGMMARFYGRGIGAMVRGLVIDSTVYFYRTPEEESADQERRSLERNRKQKEDFENSKLALDAAYNDLPQEFKRRIDRFRAANPDFRWQFESYEMSCCTDAINIATRLKTVEEIDRWNKLPWEQKQDEVSIFDGHSGNSFDCAVYLAKLWITDKSLVERAHGALTPCVGCKDYGCSHNPEEAQEQSGDNDERVIP